MTQNNPRACMAAEQALLAAALNDQACVPEIRTHLSAADFYLGAHSLIFGAVCDIDDAHVIPDVTTVYTRLRDDQSLQRAGGAAYLHTLVAYPYMAPNISHYAKQVRDAGRIRNLAAVGQRISQLVEEIPDPDRLMDLAADQLAALSMLVEDLTGQIAGRYDLPTLLAIEDVQDWIVPGVLDRQDALMVIAGEGAGKSWLLRQFAMSVAAGLHPLRFPNPIPARRTLLVDVENSQGTLRRSLRGMRSQVQRLTHDPDGDTLHENMHILTRPGGMNLRDRSDALQIEQVIREHRPDLICIGPLYKLANRGRDSWDTAAAEAREVFDTWRDKYGCAFVMEHHMPKGDGKERPETPFGGSEWLRWITQGRKLHPLEDGYYELTNFRGGDREPRDLPLGLRRGGDLPWTPVWDDMELDRYRPQTTTTRR